MKKAVAILGITLAGLVIPTQASLIVFTTDGTSTGDYLDGIGAIPTSVDVVEIPGLTLTIATATDGHTLNSNSGDFGVDSDVPGDVNDRFDFGEAVLMSFNKDVRINKIDFSNFDDGETFQCTIGTAVHTIAYSDLDNKVSDYIENLKWDVSAGTTIRMEVTSAGDSLSMDQLDITVIPEPAAMGLVSLAFGGLFFFHRKKLLNG